MDSRNLFDCPISLQPMRHPVIASDGQCYEASVLLRHIDECGLISPISRQPITGFQYARLLVDIIDSTTELEDRFEYYHLAPVLAALQRHIERARQPRVLAVLDGLPKMQITQSILFAAGSYAILWLLNSVLSGLFEREPACDADKEQDVNHGLILCLATLLFALDLSVRSRFESGVGLLGLFGRSFGNEAIRSIPEQTQVELGFDYPNSV